MQFQKFESAESTLDWFHFSANLFETETRIWIESGQIEQPHFRETKTNC